MCGVVGYVGRRTAQERLLARLARLEYRVYGSAGICLLGDGRLRLVRAVGKLDNLRLKVDGTFLVASVAALDAEVQGVQSLDDGDVVRATADGVTGAARRRSWSRVDRPCNLAKKVTVE